MTNNLIQELLKHVNLLQQQNQQLKKSIFKYNADIQELCKITGFENWDVFIEWVKQHFNDSQQISKISNEQTEECNMEALAKKLFVDQKDNLSTISQEGSQISSKISESKISSIQIEGKVSYQNFDSSKIYQVAHDFRKLQNKRSIQYNDEEEFSDFECIVLENNNLRREINILRKDLESTKESLFSMIIILKNQENISSIKSTRVKSNK